ncbi:fimbrial protein [Pseudomonas sp. KNUC1026]|uniref:fimbrial protein n=1 Tax=Pseudomonas sp. KNUC1026 TaxID=2893890 RepID=UPI001F26FB45|nr:fimbrial protein [Pseudomonas sp. KNUC1026]UFH48287.1 fimbrial protein [Pseudomonas sp. KNUC1026]
MKRFSLGFALMAISGMAMANTGTIQFKGKITDATCPIEVVDPISGGNGSIINLGTYTKDFFTAAKDRTRPVSFQLLIKDGAACGFAAGDEVTVTYSGLDGSDSEFYLIKPGADAAKNIAIALQDNTRKDVPPDTPSSAYKVNETGESRLNFTAAMVATTNAVTAGAVDADVQFVVNLP